jgi:pimeloyl-ACP methyl ester carboxylesterase
MTRFARTRQAGRELAQVVPRSVDVLRSDDPDWSVASGPGARQLGEVVLDELVVTGMTLGAPPPELTRPLSDYEPAAQEMTALGVDGAHGEPEPLKVNTIERKRIGVLRYERVTFEHEPTMPASLAVAGHAGPATAVVHLCRHDEARRPWLVWVHGAGQGSTTDLLFSRARRLQRALGVNVALPIQPGHGTRRKEWPTYPDTDPLDNVAGMIRAISEARAVVRWLAPQATTVGVAGVSLGSAVAALVSHLEPVDAVALYTPIRGVNAMIALHLPRWGDTGQGREAAAMMGSDVITALTSVIDPVNAMPSPPPERRLIVGAWYDQMAMRDPALVLHERYGGRLYWHDGGHAGQLFSRRVQRVTEDFLRTALG